MSMAGPCTSKAFGCKRSASLAEQQAALAPPGLQAVVNAERCFLLHEVGVGEIVRAPAESCSKRVTPASTFKIAHALAGLDAGVLKGADEVFHYDHSWQPFDAWQRDHTLATAMRYSVVWYFQQLAQQLGPEREAEYLKKLGYGNADASSNLRSFWLYESLQISPEEQERFLLHLYDRTLPVSGEALATVQRILVQPQGLIVNAAGEHPFAQPWPAETVLSAKTGSASRGNAADVQWLLGHVRRGERSWIFVSNVVGQELSALAAIDLAAVSLKSAGVL
jgi:beta-lactamase class D